MHLWGYVGGTAVKDAHRTAAENVPGLKRVENHMNILPPEVHFGIYTKEVGCALSLAALSPTA